MGKSIRYDCDKCGKDITNDVRHELAYFFTSSNTNECDQIAESCKDAKVMHCKSCHDQLYKTLKDTGWI